LLNGLDLFSGIGGLSVALAEWVRPLAYCEIDPYCQGVLLNQMELQSIYRAPIWDDIRSLDGFQFPENSIDLIFGGFPCQDISIGGLGKGLDGERSCLYWEIHRLIGEIKPTFVFLENVPAICIRGGSRIIRSLTEMGYECRWCVMGATDWVDQKRERWFLLAKSSGIGRLQGTGESLQSPRSPSISTEFADHKLSSMEQWTSFAQSMREVNGIPHRMERVTALGNAVVPQQAKAAFKKLMGSYD
jgi:DNA (cytosine-5)-methyltransferase 1